MSTTHTRKRVAAGALLSVGVAFAGMGLAGGAAQASPAVLCRWAPGPDVRPTTAPAHVVGAQAIPRCRPAISV